MVYSQTHFYGA